MKAPVNKLLFCILSLFISKEVLALTPPLMTGRSRSEIRVLQDQARIWYASQIIWEVGKIRLGDIYNQQSLEDIHERLDEAEEYLSQVFLRGLPERDQKAHENISLRLLIRRDQVNARIMELWHFNRSEIRVPSVVRSITNYKIAQQFA